MEWGSIIIYGLLILGALAVIARICGQTLPEFFSSMKGWITGTGEDAVDTAREI
jgi:hypothetical protein